MPLFSISFSGEQSHGQAPGALSIDTQGLDLAFLELRDLERFPAKVVCVETIDAEFRRTAPIMGLETARFPETMCGAARGMAFFDTFDAGNNART